jgi:hypothetical protein
MSIPEIMPTITMEIRFRESGNMKVIIGSMFTDGNGKCGAQNDQDLQVSAMAGPGGTGLKAARDTRTRIIPQRRKG